MGFENVFNAHHDRQSDRRRRRVAAYASVMDAQTNDPTYVPAQ
jgi:hypothetical protein